MPVGIPILPRDNSGSLLVDAIIPRYEDATDMDAIVLKAGEIAVTSDTNQVRIGDGATAGGQQLSFDSAFVRVVQASGTPASNGQALVAAYTAAKALTPGGSALSTTNRAYVLLMPGRYDVTGISGGLTLDTSYVDLIGINMRETVIVLDETHQLKINQDNIHLTNLSFYVTGTSAAGIVINAGAGGSYSATNTAFRWTNVYIEAASSGTYIISFNSSITTFGGLYRNVGTSGCNLFSVFTGLSGALTVSANFYDCYLEGAQTSSGLGGAFGGGSDGVVSSIFTGDMVRCRNVASTIGLIVRGRMESCRFRNNRPNYPAIYAGNGGRFYKNIFSQSSTGSPYSIGYAETASITAVYNVMRTNGIDTTDHSGSAITNAVSTSYNISDDNFSV